MSRMGGNARDIAGEMWKLYKISVTPKNIKYRLKMAEERGGLLYQQTSPRRPDSLDDRTKRRVLGEVRKNPFRPYSDIAKSFHTSRDKIHRIAKETLVYRFIAAEKPFLTAQHQRIRLQWARDRAGEDWSKVIFTDEAQVVLGEQVGTTSVLLSPLYCNLADCLTVGSHTRQGDALTPNTSNPLPFWPSVLLYLGWRQMQSEASPSLPSCQSNPQVQ